MSLAGDAIEAVQRLTVPQGALAGQRLRLAPFQRKFIRGALADGVNLAALSVARGNAKSAISAGLAVTHLAGWWNPVHQRQVDCAARTRQQGQILFDFVQSFIAADSELSSRVIAIRKMPTLEIEMDGPDGPHRLRVLASNGRAALGGAPTLVVADERAAWVEAKADEMDAALLTGAAKRGGRSIFISTSARDDGHAFSRLIDDPPPGAFSLEFRAPADCRPDTLKAIRAANPGTRHGIIDEQELLRAAKQAVARGGSFLASFRNLHLNQRVDTGSHELLLHTDVWQRCETEHQPPREGPVCIGLDLGEAASMSAAAFFWPVSLRLECIGWFPGEPDLAVRGLNDGVGGRYRTMAEREELRTLGQRSVPIKPWLEQVLAHVEGCEIAEIVCDRFKQSFVSDAFTALGYRGPINWRGNGFIDGGADVDMARRMAHDGRIAAPVSLLLRSAFEGAICQRDASGNAKLSKSRSRARIDAVSATVLAVASGYRFLSRPAPKPARVLWA